LPVVEVAYPYSMARFRVGPVRFGGGRRPSVSFGAGPFGATFGGGWHSSGGRESSGSRGEWSGSSGEWSENFSQRIKHTPWDDLHGMASNAAGAAENLRSALWGYSMFIGTLFWITYWQVIAWTTLAQSLKDMAKLAAVLAILNFIYSRKLVPRLQRQLRFVSAQRFMLYLVGWLALTTAITVCWILVPEFRPGYGAGPNWVWDFGILPYALGNKYALWILSYVLLGWTLIRQVLLRSISALEREVRDKYQELSSTGPVTSGYASESRISEIQNNIANSLQECAWVTETFRASNYLTRAAWRSPRTAKK